MSDTKGGRVGYINNGDSIMVMWEPPHEDMKIDYKIYFAGEDGNYKLAGTSTYNFFISSEDVNNIKSFYVEAYNTNGRYMMRTQDVAAEINSSDIINVTAIKSYNGVTINWSDRRTVGSYYVMKKTSNGYIYMFPLPMFQITLDVIKEGDIIKIVQCDEKGWPAAMSKDFVLSSDKFDLTPPAEKKLSVIMPVFNDEKFLSVGVDSVLASTMKDLELIIVDDGSTDKSAEMADWYQKTYPGKVKAIHTENQGAGMARNEGLKAAEGKYVAFADSDDLVGSGMYELLCERAEKYDCDMSVCDHFALMPNSDRIFVFTMPGHDDNAVYPADDLLSLAHSENYHTLSVCDKVYRTDFVREHPLPDRLFEDVAWSPVIYSYAEKFCYTKALLYCFNRVTTLFQPTMSTWIMFMDTEEKAKEMIASYNYILKEGNQEKRGYLMLICARLAVMQVLEEEKLDGSVADVFVKFLTKHKKEIKENEYIANDKWLSENLEAINKKYKRPKKASSETSSD